MSYYPVFLDLRGKRCVVIGGGTLAAQKAVGLAQAGASVEVYAAEAVPELLDQPVALFRRPYRKGDLAGARLAIDAGGDPAVTAIVRLEADEQGVLLNVMDVPAACDFIAPAVVKRGPLQVAISTSGESPFLASALRRRLEAELGEEWREFVKLVGEVRRDLRCRGVPLADQTRIYSRLLDSSVLELLRQGAVAAARREIARFIQEDELVNR
ncbi:MAG: bifunctional precorrin-2 dehydrogenase/sirohydrochlorin ferrochelatase [Chloroflexota bacterium]